MRWPLRFQIMLPMASVMLFALLASCALSAMLRVRATKTRIAAQIESVAQLLEQSNFPLSEPVLRQMHTLSGADFVLVDGTGRITATSGVDPRIAPQLIHHTSADAAPISLDNRVWARTQGYFHTRMPLETRRGADSAATIHILYPEAEYQRAWQHAVYPSIGLVVVALPVAMLLAAVTASRVSGRMTRLQGQVERIAGGEFYQLHLPQRDDEIRALSQAVNRMAVQLAQYEDEVRRTERMRTLAVLGGGIAHQLRNSATGCSMALDLHTTECPIGESCESLDVAKRQLRSMEQYVQRFLQLGKPSDERPAGRVIFAELIEDLLPLVEPAARHADIDVRWNCAADCADAPIRGNAQQLSQVVINLLVNAIEAAEHAVPPSDGRAMVSVDLARHSDNYLILSVSDTGPGPSDEVQRQIFEPFNTDKPDGVGLGLNVAREIVAHHGGKIHWQHVDAMTRFCVELPLEPAEASCA